MLLFDFDYNKYLEISRKQYDYEVKKVFKDLYEKVDNIELSYLYTDNDMEKINNIIDIDQILSEIISIAKRVLFKDLDDSFYNSKILVSDIKHDFFNKMSSKLDDYRLTRLYSIMSRQAVNKSIDIIIDTYVSNILLNALLSETNIIGDFIDEIFIGSSKIDNKHENRFKTIIKGYLRNIELIFTQDVAEQCCIYIIDKVFDSKNNYNITYEFTA